MEFLKVFIITSAVVCLMFGAVFWFVGKMEEREERKLEAMYKAIKIDNGPRLCEYCKAINEI